MIYDNLVIVGSGMPDNRIYRKNPPGDVQAFDVTTGERVWSFHTIPQEGEFGNDTWEDESWSYTGSTNVWAPFTIDEERGLVYLPVVDPEQRLLRRAPQRATTSSPSRSSCLDARTGKRVWHFQTVHHGVWDYDLPGPPNIVDDRGRGQAHRRRRRRREDGLRLRLRPRHGRAGLADRRTSRSGERRAGRAARRHATLSHEAAAVRSPGVDRGRPRRFHARDQSEGPESRGTLPARRHVRSRPRSKARVILPGVWGGANWGGAGFDPETGILYVKASNGLSSSRWENRSRAPRTPTTSIAGAPPLEVEGLPIHKPPYATLTAIDLNHGEHAWQIPFGDMPSLHEHPLFDGVEVPPTGEAPPQHGQSGPLVTAGGLVFISARRAPISTRSTKRPGSSCGNGARRRAQRFRQPDDVPSPSGQQMIVLATSTSRGEDAQLMAFAVPGAP